MARKAFRTPGRRLPDLIITLRHHKHHSMEENNIEMKDRIRQVMETMHFSQQEFAQYIDMSPASLSSIFNGRTKPTLNIVEAIKRKLPEISTDWLMFGTGEMSAAGKAGIAAAGDTPNAPAEPVLDFDGDSAPTPHPDIAAVSIEPARAGKRPEGAAIAKDDVMNYPDRLQRHITEIRVYFDDQTYETFVPSKQ